MKLRFLVFIVLIGFAQITGAKTSVIVVTDIGTDIDDTWALAQILRSSTLDLKLVLTDTGDTRYRASVAAKLLETAGIQNIPVAMGDKGEMDGKDMNQLAWVRGYVLDHYLGGVLADGVKSIVDTIARTSGDITIVSIGAAPTLARAVAENPSIAARCKFVGMYGSFDLGYGGSRTPSAEANVVANPKALRTLLAAPWKDILLTPLDTCGLVSLTGSDYHSIWCSTSDPLLNAVIENYCVFAPRVSWMKCDYFTLSSTTLFDCVAVYLAEAEDLVEITNITFDVTDDGFTKRNAEGACKARIAVGWKNRQAFEHRLATTLRGK